MDDTSAPDRATSFEQHDFNATDDASTLGFCVHRLFERAADSYPNNTALICARTKLSYRELNELANRLARGLIRHGVRRGDLVVVAMDRSVDLVVALLGVLKAGAAYVPLDEAFPMERIQQVMEDARPRLVVTGNSPPDALSPWKSLCLSVDQGRDGVDRDVGNLDMDVGPEHLAYVIYTSGSTGRPKGVEMTHNTVSNYLTSLGREPGCGETDRLLAVTTVSFDMAVPELLMPLLHGAMAVIAQTHQVRDTGALLDLMESHSITMMQGTPAIWQMLLDSGWQDAIRLVKVLSSGEALSRRLADRLLARADSVWNLYGPTETSYVSVWRVCEAEAVVIGHPIANARLYVLDVDLSPLPLGSPGELYIGGACVTRGYLNRPRLTRSRILDNPFHEGTMYRTGDQACFIAPGKLRLLGRIDSQVKIRGYRIELGDVEAAITKHGDVSATAVVQREDRLVAYCVRDAKANRPGPGEEALDGVLRRFLAERLPAYMVPAFFVELDALPVTLNGKVDRKALPAPVQQARTGLKPATELEARILAIWSSVLGHDSIGADDNFFNIGGDSVRVVGVQAELTKLLRRPISTAKLFEHYTIKALAAYLGGSTEDKTGLEEPVAARPYVRNDDQQDIAIVSMACRLPGGITTPEEFWELLSSGRDAIVDVPKDRWDADALYDADPDAPGKSYCRRGGFLSSIDLFDAPYFGISPREARALDPTQHIMLETCWEALERAGYTSRDLRGSQTGVFIGISDSAVHGHDARCRGLQDLGGYVVTGSAGGTLSGRVSYTLGLEGPALTVDTACSSSLVTTHLACNALRQGECDLAVSGGISLILNPGLHVEFSRLRGMSPDGRCRAFAADTQGTGWGEGAAVVVLKRLADAQRDGDAIHAVLRGTAVNHGGSSAAGLTIPSGPAQQRLIRTALTASALQPADIDYVEAHGTGTRLGDPIEGGALAGVFGGSRPGTAEPLWVGSAKSNLGHTLAAAGLVGVIKVVLAMQHSTLPPTLHVAQPTPAVDWEGAHMAPVQEKRAWPSRAGRVRRAGISAFGIGGTNAHAILEEAPRPAVRHAPAAPLPRAVPLVLSGHTDAALGQQAEKLRLHLSGGSDSRTDRLGDVAFSLATARNHLRQRVALMAGDKAELLGKLAAVTGAASSSSLAEPPRLAMLFTGQGSQFPGMGRDLAKHHPVFRAALDDIAAHFAGLERPLLDVMWADDGTEAAALLRRTDYAQPALFGLEVALWRLWESWGVRPALVMGHSVGELAAAHVAGVMDLPDACRMVAARGRLMEEAVPGGGGMVSLEASAAETAAAIRSQGLCSKVSIAGHNTPSQTVASGNVEAIETLAAYFAGKGRKSKTLDVSRAFHSHHIDGMLAAFRAVAETVRFHQPTLAVVSTLSGRLAEPGQLDQAGYWVQQARSPVRFSDGIQTLADQGVTVFVELGPRPVLSAMGATCLDLGSAAWLPSLVPNKDDALVMQASLAELHVRHVPVEWSAYFEPFGCRRVELPTYAFQRERLRPAAAAADDAAAPPLDSQGHLHLDTTMGWDLRKTLSVANPEQHAEIVLGVVRETAAETLGFASPSAVDVDGPLKAMGVDSLTAVLMRNRLASQTGLPLPALDQQQDLRALSQALLSQLQVSSSSNTTSASSPAMASSTSWASSPSSSSSLDMTAASKGHLDASLTFDNPECPESALVAVAAAAESCHPRQSSDCKRHALLDRVLCPLLGLHPPHTSPRLFPSALSYFSRLPWCSLLMHDFSPTSGLLPGYGQAVPFVPRSFNPASPRHDQFVGNTLSHGTDGNSGSKSGPLQHMLSLFRPSDPRHLDDPLRPIPRVASLYALGDGTSGYEGILHGGLTATLLDESISVVHELNTALGKTGCIFAAINVTASLNIRFLAPVATTEAAVCVTAWMEDIQGRNTVMKAELTNSKGDKLAVAESVFAAVESKT
ncbi:hypothetical protein G6O67_007788 [Ophiocordyceps sinensis]|uniref:Polyketide synthase n=2 Tax=Ophiocordyceps sinensis TaxID=72228 RepID=A0A8H4PP19_9HYPO|nr:hypothetical protein G6O67_007788 [Ophiocordyceps sinensis]